MSEVNILSRAKQIARLKSRDITLSQHSFNNIKGPMVHQVLSRDDTLRLYEIATSIKLSNKPKEKFQRIDEIMNRRGFVKLGRGTNRVVYRCLEDTSFVVKVAFDDVGCKDNPREFINQGIFQPFVTKIFDYSPEGAVGTAERVEPITNRAQFLAVSDDVFTLLDMVLITGEYILADVGSNYWANYGVRQGFGPVLLDFPYVFKLDGTKLYCHAPAFASTGICGGEIDFDAGFNELYCKKCGAKYSASELAECTKVNIETPFIGVGIGVTNMNMVVSVDGVKKVISSDNNEVGFKTPTAKIGAIDFGKFIKRSEEEVIDVEAKEVVEAPQEEVKVVEEEQVEVSDTTTKQTFNKLEDTSIDDIAKEAVENIEKKEVKSNKEKSNPFTAGPVKTYKEQFDEAFKKLISVLDVVKTTDKENLEYYTSTMVGLAKDIITDNKDNESAIEDIYEVVSEYYSDYYQSDNADSFYEMDEENEESTEEVVIDEADEPDTYTGIAWYQASNINVKDIFANEGDCPVLVLNNEDGTYLRDEEGRLIAIDDIDGQNLASLQFVSKKVMQNIEKETESVNDVLQASNNTGAFPPSQS